MRGVDLWASGDPSLIALIGARSELRYAFLEECEPKEVRFAQCTLSKLVLQRTALSHLLRK